MSLEGGVWDRGLGRKATALERGRCWRLPEWAVSEFGGAWADAAERGVIMWWGLQPVLGDVHSELQDHLESYLSVVVDSVPVPCPLSVCHRVHGAV